MSTLSEKLRELTVRLGADRLATPAHQIVNTEVDAIRFLRDHGPDLLSALEDAERWQACCENTSLFIDAAFSTTRENKGKHLIDAAIDQARQS